MPLTSSWTSTPAAPRWEADASQSIQLASASTFSLAQTASHPHGSGYIPSLFNIPRGMTAISDFFPHYFCCQHQFLSVKLHPCLNYILYIPLHTWSWLLCIAQKSTKIFFLHSSIRPLLAHCACSRVGGQRNPLFSSRRKFLEFTPNPPGFLSDFHCCWLNWILSSSVLTSRLCRFVYKLSALLAMQPAFANSEVIHLTLSHYPMQETQWAFGEVESAASNPFFTSALPIPYPGSSRDPLRSISSTSYMWLRQCIHQPCAWSPNLPSARASARLWPLEQQTPPFSLSSHIVFPTAIWNPQGP